MIQSQYEQVSDRHTYGAQSQFSESLPSAQRNFLPSNVKGKDLFDSVLWKDPVSTSVFYKFTASLRKKIREDVQQATPTHRFIRTLRDSRKLVRCYTQNIDGLESREGLCTDLSRGKGNRARFTKKVMEKPRAPARSAPNGDQDGGCEVVQFHGDLELLRCNLCQKTCGWGGKGRESLLLDGKAPECLSCAVSDQQRRDRGKRGTKVGTLRPNIVLYGEEHPAADILGTITTHDLGLAPDVLLILGTSLRVHGLKILVKEFARSVRARSGGKGKVIFINLSKPSESMWKDAIDYWVSMDCDEWIGALRRHRPDLWQIQKEIKLQTTKTLHGVDVHKQRVVNPEEEKENTSTTAQESASLKIARPSAQRKTGRPLGDAMNKALGQNLDVALRTELQSTVFDMKVSQQLPTPPPSGYKASFQATLKRPMPSNTDFASPKTPSKRARTSLDIWEDEENSPGGANRIGGSDREKVLEQRKSSGGQTPGRNRKAKSMAERPGSLR